MSRDNKEIPVLGMHSFTRRNHDLRRMAPVKQFISTVAFGNLSYQQTFITNPVQSTTMQCDQLQEAFNAYVKIFPLTLNTSAF